MKLLTIFIFISLYYFIVNKVRFLKCKRFLKIYCKNEKNWNLTQQQDEIIDLFKKADIEDAFVPYVEPVGNRHETKGMASVFQNLACDRAEIKKNVLSMFHRSVGIYRKRCWDAFNPLFWLEAIFDLPKNILKYFGIPSEHIVVKISQFFYWFISSIISFFIIFFKSETTSFLKKFFH